SGCLRGGRGFGLLAFRRLRLSLAVCGLMAVRLGTAGAIYLPLGHWLFLVGHFGGRAFDHRLRTGAVFHLLGLSAHGRDRQLVILAIHNIVEIVNALTLLRLHLGHGGGDQAIVVLRVLQVIFSHHAVAGTLRITGEGGVFIRDLLCGPADLHIRTIALVAAGKRIRALAVVAAAAHAPVLLLWPHTILFVRDDYW